VVGSLRELPNGVARTEQLDATHGFRVEIIERGD
jgi:hypothetical protein